MVALDAAQVDRDLGFERGIDRFGQIVPQQDVFRRNRCVRLQFEYPMSIGLLQGDERAGCCLDAVVDSGRRPARFCLKGHAVPQTTSQRNWLAESRYTAPWTLVPDRVGHELTGTAY